MAFSSAASLPEPDFGYQYHVGAAVPIERPYVRRVADEQLYRAMQQGQFCYVFNCRQMGKSSLRTRTMERLRGEGWCCASVDLSRIGADHVTPDSWYAGMISELGRATELFGQQDGRADELEVSRWLDRHQHLSPVQRLARFIEDELLVRVAEGSIAIFVDELDSVLSLEQNHGVQTSDFFALIRGYYNLRADYPVYNRLTFVLLGVATPSRLIRDKSRTPFNIGRGIDLGRLALENAESLLGGLRGIVADPERVLAEIFAWSGGQPFLTHWLCEQVQQAGFEAEALPWIAVGGAKEAIEELVRERILESWQSDDVLARHFEAIEERLLRQENQANRLLGLYDRALEQDGLALSDEDEASQMELRLAGLLVREQGRLVVFNRIYAAAFDRAWVQATLEKLRPYSEAFEAWVASDCADESRLLQGQALADALAWAENRQLMAMDDRFLRASQAFEQQELKQAKKQAEQLRFAAEKEAADAKQTAKKLGRRTKRILWGSVAIAASLISASSLLVEHANQKLERANFWSQLNQKVEAQQQAWDIHTEPNQLDQLPLLIEAMENARTLIDEAGGLEKLSADPPLISPVEALKKTVDQIQEKQIIDTSSCLSQLDSSNIRSTPSKVTLSNHGEKIAALFAHEEKICIWDINGKLSEKIDLDIGSKTKS